MKKLFLFFVFTVLSLNLFAQTAEETEQKTNQKTEQTQEQKEQKQEHKQTQTESQETPKQEEIYTKDFLNQFATALYTEKENLQDALKIYEELFALSPEDTTLLDRLSEICFKTQNKDCAQKYVPLYLNVAPDNSRALAFSAQLAWQQGNLKQAQEYYSKALKNGAEQDKRILMQYLTLLNAIDKEEAIKFLRELEQENNLLYLPINLEIAQIYLNQNQPEKAVSTLDEVLKKYPQNTEFYHAKILIYESLREVEKALEVYGDMDKEGLLTDQDLVKIGAYYLLQKQPQESKKYYERAYQQNPSNPQACEFLSLWEQSQKKYLKAEEYLRHSEDFKTSSSLRVKQVHLLKLAGEPQKAKLAMQQAYKDFDGSIEIGFYYALLLEDNKEYKQAAKVLEDLLKKQPDNEELLINYAYTLNKLKSNKKMQKILEQIIAKNPKNDEALNFLGYYLVDQTNQIERGGEYIKQALALNPKNGAMADSLAWYYYKKGDYKQALNLLENLPDKDKKDPEIIWHLAKVYQILEDNSNALKYYQLLLNSEEYGAQAQKEINKINKK